MKTIDDDPGTVAHLLGLEAERCRAISELDMDAVADLLAEDFTYGFLSARIEDKPTYLAGLPSRPHGISRSGLSVRLYGNTAVMLGEFETTDLQTTEVLNAGTGLQVWVRGNDEVWRIVALTTTRFGERSTHWANKP